MRVSSTSSGATRATGPSIAGIDGTQSSSWPLLRVRWRPVVEKEMTAGGWWREGEEGARRERWAGREGLAGGGGGAETPRGTSATS